MEALVLSILIFLGAFLILSIQSIHCPYWQLPLGSSFLFGAMILTLIVPSSWVYAAFAWFGGLGTAVLVVCVRRILEHRRAHRNDSTAGSVEKQDTPAA